MVKQVIHQCVTCFIKGYGAIFICIATKAVHLEFVSDLTTETFISALKRSIEVTFVEENHITSTPTMQLILLEPTMS